MKKRYVYVLIIVAICGLLVIVFSGKERSNIKTMAKGSDAVSVVGKRSVTQLTEEKKSDSHTSPTVVISNGVFVVDTREKLVYGTPGMEKYRAGDQRQAAIDGAEAKVTLHVVDTEGKEVSDAFVSLTFAFRQKNKPQIGLTDSNGLFVAQGTLTDDIIYRVSKTGYYETFDRFFMAKAATRCVENGRWIPWNPTLQVTLKEIRKPIPMYVKCFEGALSKNVETGFDCIVGDFLMPHGKGKTADFIFRYTSECTVWHDGNMTNRLDIVAPPDGGLMQESKNVFSLLVSAYNAPVGGYLPQITYSLKRTESKISEQMKLDESEYLVFLSRVEKDPLGKIREQKFGKIYAILYGENPDKKNSGVIRFTYYFNPMPNDRNLEFDGKNNLFSPAQEEPFIPNER
jgi:hypothetical protein